MHPKSKFSHRHSLSLRLSLQKVICAILSPCSCAQFDSDNVLRISREDILKIKLTNVYSIIKLMPSSVNVNKDIECK